MCASVERRPSVSIAPKHRRSMDGGVPLEPRPHTRVDDESAIEKKYSFGDVLGQGSFGVVREVTNRLTRQQFAMKIVNKEKPGSSAILLLEREVEVLKRVNHAHIIKLEEVFETAKKMYIIMELCKGGELSVLLRKKGYFREEEAKIIMRGLTEAVVYMHDNDMVHRDLKLENILLSTEDSEDEFNVKVTDFGLAHMRLLPDDDMVSRCGTLYYMAPEVLNTKHEYTKMCDVWSLGVIMYNLLCGRVPFQSDNAAKLEELILQGELKFMELEWINTSQGAKDLIRSMLCVDTTHRFTARRILDDPWFTGQPARVLNALDLMRDMTLDVSAETSSASNSLETVQEVTGKDKHHQGQPGTPKKTPTKKLGGRRTSSTSAVTVAIGGGNLRSPSTSALAGKTINNTPGPSSTSHGQHRSRSLSVGSKLVASPRRPNTSYVRTPDRKHS